MPRARIDRNGIAIARAGYDVDTAPMEHMLFSPQFTSLRLAYTGVTTVAPFGGQLSEQYYRSEVWFPAPLLAIPIVLVANIINENETDQSQIYEEQFPPGNQDGTGYVLPWYSVQPTASNFTLYARRRQNFANANVIGPRSLNWRWWAFHNTIS